MSRSFLTTPETICSDTPLLAGVGHVVGLCSQPKMSRVDAGRIVALMAHDYALRDWSTVEFVREAMSTGGALVNANNAIPGFVDLTSPQPTIARLIDPLPESFLHSPQLLVCLARSRRTTTGAKTPLAKAHSRTKRPEGHAAPLADAFNPARITLHPIPPNVGATPPDAHNVAVASLCPNYSMLGEV